MLQLYNTALLPLRALLRPWAAWDASRGGGSDREWAERRAEVVPDVDPGGIWLHGSSVGEARIVTSLSRAWRQRHPPLPLSVSAFTRTGRAQLPTPPDVDAAFFLPLDFRGLPGRLLDAVRPRVLVLVETEIWPNLLHEAFEKGVAVAVVNGRLSQRRMSRYRRLNRLYGPLLSRLACVGAQSGHDAERFAELGVRRDVLAVTGNIKYDIPAPAIDPAQLRRKLGLDPDRPVVVAGSTAPGEDEQVLEAALRVRERYPGLFLVLAPRHVERSDDVERLAERTGIRLWRLSRGVGNDAGTHDGLLVDSIGQLAALYGIGAAAFVGGSLVPVGGHNVLEPPAAGSPALFGPYTENFADPAAALLQAEGALRVRDSGELADRWTELIADPARRRRLLEGARAVLETNRGAMERTLELLRPLLGTAVA